MSYEPSPDRDPHAFDWHEGTHGDVHADIGVEPRPVWVRWTEVTTVREKGRRPEDHVYDRVYPVHGIHTDKDGNVWYVGRSMSWPSPHQSMPVKWRDR